jgi:Cys-tRNA(Pro)/Cys-tRNA(Cys) deacylase
MTPAVEAAKRAGVEFRLHEYTGVDLNDGDYALAVATALAQSPARLFKTLVASVDGRLENFIVPADKQLDLRPRASESRSRTVRRRSVRPVT